MFTAIEIPKGVRDAMADAQRLLSPSGSFKHVAPDNIHVTLRFLGDNDEVMAKRIMEALESVEFEPFNIALEGFGAFPNPKKPKVIWVAVTEGAQDLVELSEKVDACIGSLGFPKEKRYHPHATISRVRGRPDSTLHDILISDDQPAFGRFKAQGFTLVSSTLTSDGSVYGDVRLYPMVIIP